ncbi:PorP/SprF family type IX secretion system membrane protein [Flammeovirga yaeyamensis]|uniref:PorP/SprF family type IX secretion system membrane protein n=1 Tax=Flammeovirga yaeyamensis TaxID=367791 RepID=A0AAX1NB48_9BACT|nr:type IX secretion system membrane protein PorP/SprF [Flammeovirga yaeyamensis]MBB3699894.1 type IX secretion system PorP/SprF family membrane protein [Flammeovirga yaeyamensis]NMF38310.1 type IX secretion system membrane protein PorP/SprF [Flammeovirga yaeyamensis]QWG04722.1 PorP/SprF family type IX secretion system membrane protein [Flammeovirga yaeyamensis]
MTRQLLILLSLNFAFFIGTTTKAQDAHLSQYYAAPLYLNPALVGTAGDGRVNMNYRNQWVGVPSNYSTFMASFDTPIPKKNIGLGVTLHQDVVGTNSGSIMDRFVMNFSGGYNLKLNKKYTLSFGLQLGFEQSSLGFYKLLFGDQIDDDGITGDPTKDRVDRESHIYPDISSGALLYGKDFWFGLSVYHMNQPKITRFTNGTDYLPVRFSAHAGYRIPLTYRWHGTVANYDDRTVSFMMHYQSQGKKDQLSTGVNLNYNPIIFGIWYRGLVVKSNEDPSQFNHDSIVFMSGVQVKRFTIGYSFDHPIGGLQFAEGNSHELSIRYDLNFYPNYRKKKRKGKVGVPTDKCPIPNL